MQSPKRPTIVDVAAAAGVGASTVSRYVRGAKSVSPAVATRIEAAVARLAYEPNIIARGLRVGRTRTLGVLFPHVANLFYATALRAIEAAAHREGFTVLLLTHNEDHRLQQTQLETLRQYRSDGILLLPAAGTEPTSLKATIGDTPLVALDRSLGRSWDSVTLCNRKAAMDATKHLLDHGHRSILAITAPLQLETLRNRVKGYEEAMRAAGSAPGVLTLHNPGQLCEELNVHFARHRRPATALVTFSYSLTVGLLHALRLGNVALSEKAFVAIDDLEFADLIDPALTTLAQPAAHLASLAIERLLQRIGGYAGDSIHTRVPGELLVRESCGCPPAARSARVPGHS